MLSHTEGYRLHQIRMNSDALHMRYVRAMRLLEPDSRIAPALALCQSKLAHVGRCRQRLDALSALCDRLLARVRFAYSRLLQVSVLSACALERSMAKLSQAPAVVGQCQAKHQAKPKPTARRLATAAGWTMAQEARRLAAEPQTE